MFEQTLEKRLGELVELRERLTSIPAATAEPDASYWDGLQEEAENLLALTQSKVEEYRDHLAAENAECQRLSRAEIEPLHD